MWKMVDYGSFFLLCGLAILTKLSSSVDDVAWLLPYMKGEAACKNAALYMCLMQLVVWVAVLASFLGREAIGGLVNDGGYWTAERVLGVASGVLLAFYTAYLFQDWYYGDDEDNDESEVKCLRHMNYCRDNNVNHLYILYPGGGGGCCKNKRRPNERRH